MVNPQNLVDILHGLCPNIGKFLDFGSSILDLFIIHLEIQLLDSRLDGVPSGQTMTDISFIRTRGASESLPDRDVSAHTEIGWVENLVCGWVGEDSLGVNTGLVGEGTESSDVVVAIISSFRRLAKDSLQRNRDLDSLGDEVLDLSEHGEVVLGLDVFWVGDHHSCNQTTKGCNTISFSDTELS